MSLHVTSGRKTFGFALAFATAVLWGILPIALKVVLDTMDGYTITWYRLLVSGLLLFPIVAAGGNLPKLKKLQGKAWLLIFVCVLGLCGNYILYILGLDRLTPSTAVVMIQLAPIFLLVGGLMIFRERFSGRQYFGFVLLIIGLALFFNRNLEELFFGFGDYTIGILLILLSAIIWASYALAQKQLLKNFPSETIMLIIYIGGIFLFLPFAHPARIFDLDGVELGLLAFCALNTLFAYGCFSEALDHLEASRVSAVLAVIPLVTIVGMKILEVAFPGFIKPESLNFLSVFGALLVVAGSMLTALGQIETRPYQAGASARNRL